MLLLLLLVMMMLSFISMLLAPLLGGFMAIGVAVSRLFGWVGKIGEVGKKLLQPAK